MSNNLRNNEQFIVQSNKCQYTEDAIIADYLYVRLVIRQCALMFGKQMNSHKLVIVSYVVLSLIIIECSCTLWSITVKITLNYALFYMNNNTTRQMNAKLNATIR